MLSNVLVANRGEIAIRVIRACKEMGINATAIYSDADRNSLHVKFANNSICIGGREPRESYLDIEKIMEAARKCDADAIHPGYGFLAENTEFVERCEKEGYIFVGPNSKTIKMAGDKLIARRSMLNLGINIVPGSLELIETKEDVIEIGKEVGYPIMIKASCGGGGRGIRVIKNKEEVEHGLNTARSEALASFGSPDLYVEKYLEGGRHIEFQIIADNYKNTVHLGERECSIQRRHQKLLEEAPSPLLDESTRKRIGDYAVRGAKAVGYRSAGTFEFLYHKNDFYFLEINTRIQVEHPVTEMVTGIDIIKEQFKIAANEKLDLKQDEINLRGHSIECRINAEDPESFHPCLGTIERYHAPSGGGIRIESCVYAGMRITQYYDTLLSKLISWGRNRDEAIARLRNALDEYIIDGTKTTISFHKRILANEDFIKGNISVDFIKNMGNIGFEEEREVAAVVAAHYLNSQKIEIKKLGNKNWKFAKREFRKRWK
ncbi:MAG: acetyl-CoA carboxylase biotin carboxylase subunit [Candidatus Thermoplasmatota archaeon]